MSEPTRLLKEDGNEFERTLLCSAKDDIPSPALRNKTLAAFGLGASVAVASATMATTATAASAATTASTAATAATATTTATASAAATAASTAAMAASTAARLALIKWIGVGVVSGLVTVASVAVTHSDNPAAPMGPAVSTAAPLAPAEFQAKAAKRTEAEAPAPPPVDTGAPSAEAPAPPPAVLAPSGATPALAAATSKSAKPDARADAPHPLASAEPPRSALADEIAALDFAREAIAAGDGARAFRALDLHDRTFPRPLLGPEAMVLRLEAMILRGDRAGASRVGSAFLAAHPQSPHASRIRSLIGATGSAEGAVTKP